jgi:hypothetical protein
MRIDYYVYAHQKPDGSVFYVGKGTGKRAFERQGRNKYWKRIAAKHGFRVVFLEWLLDESEAYDRERFYIKYFKGKNQAQANVCDGGEGGISGVFGENHFNWKPYITKEVAEMLYCQQKLSTEEIARIYGKSATAICGKLEHWGIKRRSAGRARVKILCETTGEVFETLSECAKKYGLFSGNIQKQINGKYKECGGKTFKKI